MSRKENSKKSSSSSRRRRQDESWGICSECNQMSGGKSLMWDQFVRDAKSVPDKLFEPTTNEATRSEFREDFEALLSKYDINKSDIECFGKVFFWITLAQHL